jgi:prevent-host-death family protein
MEKTISVTEAKQKFLQLLQGVRLGRTYVVTSHGKPVAKIRPVEESGRVGVKARGNLLTRLRLQPTVEADRWYRDELYDDAH